MANSRVLLQIGGMEFYVNTDDDPSYIESLAAEVDQQIQALLQSSRNLSITQAAVMVALDIADQFKKSNNSTDNLRGQIKDYLEDSARARMEAEAARREVDRLQAELARLKG